MIYGKRKLKYAIGKHLRQMAAISRQVVKYFLAIAIVAFFIVSFFSTLMDAYSYTIVLVEPLQAISPMAVLTSPIFWIGLLIVVIVAIAYARVTQGNFVSLAVWCIKTADSAVGNRWFSEPVVKGIISSDSVAWKFEYWTGGEVRPLSQCCPRCGTELDEKILPTDVVHGTDSGFKPNQNWKDTEAKTWTAVHGAPKSESTTEQPALACTLCRFTSPASKSDRLDRESSQKVFERHIERMKSGNPRKDPFLEYKKIAASQNRIRDVEPSPESVWDAYVATREDSELIPFDTSINQ